MADRINMPAGTSPRVSTAETSPSLTSLVGGIVDDLQRLIRQELACPRNREIGRGLA